MGLLDTLAEKLLDELSSTRRDRSVLERELREQFRRVLYDYSVQIERCRVALWQVRAAMVDPNTAIDRKLHEALNTAQVARDEIFSQGLVSRVKDSELRLDPLTGREDLLREFIGEYLIFYHPLANLTTEVEALDDIWTRLRPLLDETLDSSSVNALRTARHELRADFERLQHLLRRLSGPSGGADLADHVAQVDKALARWDMWARVMSELSKTVSGPRGSKRSP